MSRFTELLTRGVLTDGEVEEIVAYLRERRQQFMTGAHYHALEHPTNDSTSKLLDRLQMPASVVEEMVRAVPDDVVRAIVRDNCPRAAPTPPAPKSTVDQLVERFGPPKA